MKKLSSLVIVFSSLAMIASFYLPLWEVNLEAPQYPEGLVMQIWLNHLSGDVNIISGLNHYIGMKHIDESMFPEFQYMGKIIIGFIISGVFVGLMRKKWLLTVWFVAFLAVAALGIYDFWSWEYDYGHNLSPTAAIKIPGMSYQPPLIGSKQLLNFNASSYPSFGGLIIMIAGTLSLCVFIFEIFFAKKTDVARKESTASQMKVVMAK
jgi:copper chaperone NosL